MTTEQGSVVSDKRIGRVVESRKLRIVLSRGRELPKAGPITGVKS